MVGLSNDTGPYEFGSAADFVKSGKWHGLLPESSCKDSSSVFYPTFLDASIGKREDEFRRFYTHLCMLLQSFNKRRKMKLELSVFKFNQLFEPIFVAISRLWNRQVVDLLYEIFVAGYR